MSVYYSFYGLLLMTITWENDFGHLLREAKF